MFTARAIHIDQRGHSSRLSLQLSSRGRLIVQYPRVHEYSTTLTSHALLDPTWSSSLCPQLGPPLLYFIILCSNLCLLYFIFLYYTLCRIDPTLLRAYLIILISTWIYSTLLNVSLSCSTLSQWILDYSSLYLILQWFPRFCYQLDHILRRFERSRDTWFYSYLLGSTYIYLISVNFILLHCTWCLLDYSSLHFMSTWSFSSLHGSTLLYLINVYFILLLCTWCILDSSLLYLVLLRAIILFSTRFYST